MCVGGGGGSNGYDAQCPIWIAARISLDEEQDGQDSLYRKRGKGEPTEEACLVVCPVTHIGGDIWRRMGAGIAQGLALFHTVVSSTPMPFPVLQCIHALLCLRAAVSSGMERSMYLIGYKEIPCLDGQEEPPAENIPSCCPLLGLFVDKQVALP
jgi:hypothetical protein